MVYFSRYGRSTPESTNDNNVSPVSHKTSSSVESYPSKHKACYYYSTEDVPSVIAKELEGKLEFDSPNVLRRLRIDDVDDKLVKQIRRKIKKDEVFVKSRSTLDELREAAEQELEDKSKDEDDPQCNERWMMKPLNQIFTRILELAVTNDDGRARQYDRKWIASAEKTLLGEGDTCIFPKIEPFFTLCDDYKEMMSMTGKKKWEVEGPKPAEENIVKAIVSQAADYARIHLTCRPFLLFSVGLLIFGKEFCVAIFDRDGVQFSPAYDLWDNLDILIRIIRRMSHEMSPEDFGQDPNVNLLPSNHPNSVTCRNIATALAKGNPDLINKVSDYPTYSINFCNNKYYTIGFPVWNSFSLLGRGTSIWRVSTSPRKSLATGNFLILKTAWRPSNQLSESAIMQRVKGSHDGLVKYSQGSDVFFPSSNAVSPPKITTANLRNLNRHVEGDTTILHRLVFKTVGRPIREFDSYLEFFLAIKAALDAHKFLADQGILHCDISAGNVLLSSNPNAPDSQKGFLTDLEFSRFENATLEGKNINIIPVPSVPNPTRANQMTAPTTRTHITWRCPSRRGVILTGTVQLMACELVSSLMGEIQHPIHRTYHDVESFIWVIYYGILRRIGYVERNLNGETISTDLQKISREAFQTLFGHVYPYQIAHQRLFAFPPLLFGFRRTPWPPHIQQFFGDINTFMLAMRGRTTDDNPYGWGTHEELHVVLDKSQATGEIAVIDQ
ncbi:hypothetical protein Clacol_009801 [Clathrus columnatus]|uniref:Fungal-type protein kinase domain-containing protein n=1 Tax=Clathrus columnatus TaxID=1419009 RepID=A0AAV5AS70_9AGAM|nr:hypothetical protein Clacol_009801 [Clathrus columnatus]